MSWLACASAGRTAADGRDIRGELFRLVAEARAVGFDPEMELRAAVRRYRELVRAWERSRHPVAE